MVRRRSRRKNPAVITVARGPLAVEAAAEFLGETPAYVRRAISAKLLRAQQRRGEWIVTCEELKRYQRALAEDIAAIRARRRSRSIPGEQVHADLGI